MPGVASSAALSPPNGKRRKKNPPLLDVAVCVESFELQAASARAQAAKTTVRINMSYEPRPARLLASQANGRTSQAPRLIVIRQAGTQIPAESPGSESD